MKAFHELDIALWSERSEDLAAVKETLSRLGCSVTTARSTDELLDQVQGRSLDLIIIGLTPGFRVALDLLRGKARADGFPPVVVATDGWDIGLYLETQRLGAADALGLPVEEKELVRIICRVTRARLLTHAA